MDYLYTMRDEKIPTISMDTHLPYSMHSWVYRRWQFLLSSIYSILEKVWCDDSSVERKACKNYSTFFFKEDPHACLNCVSVFLATLCPYSQFFSEGKGSPSIFPVMDLSLEVKDVEMNKLKSDTIIRFVNGREKKSNFYLTFPLFLSSIPQL